MKKIILLSILAFGLILNTYGQKPTLELTFTAEYNEQHVPLDSILIENLTQGGKTTLYSPDTVLVLDYVTSIDDNSTLAQHEFSLSQNYPNPFNGKTAFDLNLPEADNIEIIIQDIVGRELVQNNYMLCKGGHSFTFYSGSERVYLLTVSGKGGSHTVKLLNTNNTTTAIENCKIIYNSLKKNSDDHKSQNTADDLEFALGDLLRFIGYAKTLEVVRGSDVIDDSPLASTEYKFEISEGIPCPDQPTVLYGNQVYNTVLIGYQCWLKENLNIGTKLYSYTPPANNGVIEKYCANNDNCSTYGGLYTWNEMMQYNTLGAQGICPDGWYIPTNEEWKILEGMADSQYGYLNPLWDMEGYRGFDVGKNLKSTFDWNNNAGIGTDLYGFQARSGGALTYDEILPIFWDIGRLGCFWTSEVGDPNWSFARFFEWDSDQSNRVNAHKEMSYSVRCIRPPYISVSTNEISDITSNSAICGGSINDSLEHYPVTERGVCWSTFEMPTIYDAHTSDGQGTGTFTSQLSNLEYHKRYFVRAYVSNNAGTWYGNQVSFYTSLPGNAGEPCPGIETVTYGGQVYNTVLIGDQCWFKENLNFEIGTSWCYNNNPNLCDVYGRLYDWFTAIDACPPGWKLPDGSDWMILEGVADSQFGVGDTIWHNLGWRGFDAGKSLKDTIYWYGNGDDLYGFRALPAGYYDPPNSLFAAAGLKSRWWSSTIIPNGLAAYFWMLEVNKHDNSCRAHQTQNFGYSVRCIKED